MPSVKCPKCGVQLTVAPGAVSVRCTGCGATLRLKAAVSAEPDPAASAPPPGWHYLDPAGRQQGPVQKDFLVQLIRSGAVNADTLIWREGMADWARLGDTELAGDAGSAPPSGAPGPAERPKIPHFKNEPVLVLILGIITCGLYLIYWNMKVAKVLNAVARREAISPAIAVLGGCCVPVNIYFYYLCGQCLDDLGKLIGRDGLKDKTTLLVILGFLFPAVAAMIVQGYINELYEKQ